MTLYGFKDRTTAENLKHIGETMNFNRQQSIVRNTGQETMSVKVPTEIDAVDPADGNWVPGTAVEIRYDQDGVKTETVNTVRVFNTTEDPVEVDTECMVVRQQEKWIIVSAPSSGGGSENYLCIAPSGGVPARTGSNASQTDCDIYEINASSGAISATGSTVNIYNIWSQSIASNAYFTAKKIDGVYVPDAEDCTGN